MQKKWINLNGMGIKPKEIENKKHKTKNKKMFTTKKVNVYIDINDVKEYISRIMPSNADAELHSIIDAVKQQNIDLQEKANDSLKKKHLKKIKKGYIHCPTNTAMDEISKNNLQEMIYQHGIDEINSCLQMAMKQNQKT